MLQRKQWLLFLNCLRTQERPICYKCLTPDLYTICITQRTEKPSSPQVNRSPTPELAAHFHIDWIMDLR